MGRRTLLAMLLAAVITVGSAAVPRSAQAEIVCPEGQSVVPIPGGSSACVATRSRAPARTPGPTARATAKAPGTRTPDAGTDRDSCAITSAAANDVVSGASPPSAPPAGADPNRGHWLYVICGESNNLAGGAAAVAGAWMWTRTAVPAADPAQLAQQAYDELRPQTPVVDYRPRYHAGEPESTLVGLRTYIWVERASLQTASKRVTAGGVWAQVTETVQSVTIDPGDGTAPIVCPDGGVPYDPALPLDRQVANCWHVYGRPGSFQLRVSVAWTVTWTGSGKTGGPLPAVTVTGNVAVPVQEVQTVNDAVRTGDRAG